MDKQNLLLLNIIEFLLNGDDGEASGNGERFKRTIAEFLGDQYPNSPGGGPGNTGGGFPTDYAKLLEEVQHLQEKVAYMEEQYSSNLQMFEMTINYLEEELEEAKKNSGSGNDEGSGNAVARAAGIVLNPREQLEKMFADPLFLQVQNGNTRADFVYMVERPSHIYLFMTEIPYHTEGRGGFMLLTDLLLRKIVSERRFKNAGEFVGQYHKACERIRPEGYNGKTNFDIGVCIMDKSNYELEFAGNAFTMYEVSRRMVKPHRGKAAQDDAPKNFFGASANDYPVSRLKIRQDTSFFFSNTPVFEGVNTDGTEKDFEELLSEISTLKSEEQSEYLHTFFTKFNSEGLPSESFTLVGLKF